jgi:hypothetical protein
LRRIGSGSINGGNKSGKGGQQNGQKGGQQNGGQRNKGGQGGQAVKVPSLSKFVVPKGVDIKITMLKYVHVIVEPSVRMPVTQVSASGAPRFDCPWRVDFLTCFLPRILAATALRGVRWVGTR